MDNYVSIGTVRDVQVILVSIIFLEVNLTIEHRVKTELPFLWQNLKLRWILMFGCSSSKKKKERKPSQKRIALYQLGAHVYFHHKNTRKDKKL